MNEVAEFNPKSELPDEFEYVDLESVVGTEMISHRTETKDSAPSRAQRLAQPGDVFFQTVRPYQKNNYLFSKLDNNYVFSTGYAQMRPNIDTAFLMSFLQTDSFVKIVLDNCTGTSYPAINSNDLSNLEISLPKSFEEQKKVGETIISIDNLITLHQRKSFLNFAKRNDWEQRKLETVAKFSKGSGYSKGDLIESGTPIILYGRLYTKYETIISDVDTYVKAKEGSVYSKGGEVIVPASGETAEDIARAATVYKSGILLGGDLNVVMPNEDVNPAFLAISISNGNSQRELAKKAQGKSVVHIHNEEIRNLIVPFPTKVEQNKIVDYFSNIDNLITLHRRAYYNKKGGLTNVHNDNQQHYAIL